MLGSLSKQRFVQKEIAQWGEDEVFSWIEKGYEPVLLMNESGRTKWVWKLPTAPITSVTSGFRHETALDR